ncbi:MAG: hypothetical protein ACREDS_12200, partial [Limisphaerales bacterium]
MKQNHDRISSPHFEHLFVAATAPAFKPFKEIPQAGQMRPIFFGKAASSFEYFMMMKQKITIPTTTKIPVIVGPVVLEKTRTIAINANNPK